MKQDMINNCIKQISLTREKFSPNWGMKKSLQMLLLFLMMAGSMNVWAQTDYSGTYYILSGSPNKQTKDGLYYVCPTEDWAFFHATDIVNRTDNGQPFLTTHQMASGEEIKYKWIIEKHTRDNKDYYAFRYGVDYNGSSRYMSYSLKLNGAGTDRMRIHLEKTNSPDDNELFDISETTQNNKTYLVISPKNKDANDGNKLKYLVVNGGNTDFLGGVDFSGISGYGVSNKKDGPSGFTYTTGILGTFNKIDDPNAPFYLIDVIARPTIVYNTSDKIEISAPTGATLIYTTDGSKPTAINGTVVNSNTTSFDLPSTTDVTTIKAVAVVGGELSNVATYTTPVLCGSNHPYLIQSQNNAWNGTDFHYYMIPGDEENSVLKVNTTSLFRPSMEWYFKGAGVEEGVQYYYIVNNANGKYLCYDGTSKVYMDTYANENKFKFKIVESPTIGTYNIYPYGQNIILNKVNGNADKTAVGTIDKPANNASSGNTRWRFVQPSDLDKTVPFTSSNPSTGSYTYYQFCNSDREYYVKAPASIGAYVPWVAASSADESTYWYLEEAAPATGSDWLTYYYIRNARTGAYLYYAGENHSTNNSAFKTSLTKGDADSYQFAWAHTTTKDNYFIVPKMLRDETLNNFSTMYRNKDKENLLVQKVRTTGSAGWMFSEVSDFHCATPNITWSTAENGYVITSTESDAKIYYKIGEGTLTPTTGTLYTGAIPVANYDAESLTIRAIAVRNSDGSDKSPEASETIYRVATPDFSQTEDGKVQLTCATDGVVYHYEMGANPMLALLPLLRPLP